MIRTLVIVLLISTSGWAQYEDYQSYETFSELDRYQRDYGLIFVPSLMYMNIQESNEVTGGTANDRGRGVFLYDVRLGYIFRGGFYFGILYAGESQDIENSATSLPTTNRESVGMSFGYIYKGWSFVGTVYPYSKQSLENADALTYSEGFGYQLDAAYYFRMGRYFSIGPQLVFKSIDYGKAENAVTNVNTDASASHTVFTPMISMIINLYRG